MEAAFNGYNVLLFPNLLCGFSFAEGVDTCQFAGAGKSVEPISHLFSSHTQPKKQHQYAKSHRPPRGSGWITIALIFHLFIWFAVMKELLEQHLKQVGCNKWNFRAKNGSLRSKAAAVWFDAGLGCLSSHSLFSHQHHGVVDRALALFKY